MLKLLLNLIKFKKAQTSIIMWVIFAAIGMLVLYIIISSTSSQTGSLLSDLFG